MQEQSTEEKEKEWSFTCFAILKDHQQGVKCLLELLNGHIASGSYDTTIKIWSERAYECITTLRGHTQVVMCLIQLTNSDLVSAAGELIKVWDITHFTSRATLIGHSNAIYSLIQINNSTIASGSVDKSLKLWDVSTYRFKSKLPENKEWVRVMISFNNAFLISGSDSLIHIWDTNSLSYQRQLGSHLKPVSGLCEVNETTLASCSFDCSIAIWDMLLFNKKASYAPFSSSSMTCLSLLNENHIIVGFDDDCIHIVNVLTCEQVLTIDNHIKTVTSLITLKNRQETTFLSASLDGTIKETKVIFKGK